MFSVPTPPVLVLIILLTVLTTASARPFDWGYCADDRRAVTPQPLRNSAISSLARFVPPSVDRFFFFFTLKEHWPRENKNTYKKNFRLSPDPAKRQ